ncbi:hypothetical protein PQ478_08320 [Alkalihalophilus pseudofirmus]|uniref:hypothetical protein n=1 Tax=Alkalihalophilus pseudofirmus TaxID=79885 RepID=UPI00259B578A|nr:hypothetical protein [Alkalihalophilus pseudofirmus]WEG18473.1 hypothetical protein PQ478_08320 [Alkalihalophilus pseudofirmus]
MSVLQSISDYIYKELPQRQVLLKDEEATGKPHESKLDKIKFAPLGTMYLQSNISPHPLYIRLDDKGVESDWKLLSSGDESVIQTKTISFQYFGVMSDNMSELVIPFPFDGLIRDITATCIGTDDEETVFKVEAIERDSLGVSEWEEITENHIVIPSNSHVNDESWSLKMDLVKTGLLFRITPLKKSQITGLNVQIKIEI